MAWALSVLHIPAAFPNLFYHLDGCRDDKKGFSLASGLNSNLFLFLINVVKIT